LKIPYGKTFIDIDLPETMEWQVLEKNVPFSFPSPTLIVQQAIADLARQLKNRLSPGARLLLIVPDHTRQCGLPLILPLLIETLNSQLAAEIEILIANGSHVVQPESVIRDLVTQEVFDAVPVFQHDARDASQLVHLGQTSYGTEIWLNKKVKEADFIITVGGILFHYFAGFGGGPKMLLPGVAGYETIRQNHSLTIDKENGCFHPDSREGNITTNPVYLDLAQVMDIVPNVLSLQVLLSPSQQIVHAMAGPILATQKNLLPHVKKLYALETAASGEIVVAGAGGFPADVNLIQAHKAIRHAYAVTRLGGTLIFFAQCADGVGSQTFMPYFDLGSAKNIGEELAKNFRINGQTALSLREKAEAVHIIFISDIAPDLVRQTGMTPCRSWEEATQIAATEIRKCKMGIVLANASTTVPM